MNTCATCKHWHGSDSSYRAKCEANSGVDTVSTAFDDTCSLWTSKQPVVTEQKNTVFTTAQVGYNLDVNDLLRGLGITP